MNKRVTVIGAGAWGMSLAHVMRLAGCEVTLWDRHLEHPHLEEALAFSPHIVIAVAAQAVREVAGRLQPFRPLSCLIASKGIEQSTGLLLSEVIQEILPQCKVAALGGPNLAREVIESLPCAATLGCAEPSTLMHMETWFKGSPLDVGLSSDVIGVQVAGALKNVMAIGYGLLQQTLESENMWATYLTKALYEIQTFIHAAGGQTGTTLSYAGIGDLMLTCHSEGSRNSQFGRLFPHHPEGLVEGRQTLEAVFIRTPSLSLPLMQGIYDILHGHRPLEQWPQLIIKAPHPF